MSLHQKNLDLGVLDRLSWGDTRAHRIDPRAKVLTAAAFILAVVSFPKYAVLPLVPFFLFPAIALIMADVPPGVVLRRLALVSPFALLAAAFNPVVDRAMVPLPGGCGLAAGWLSLLSVLLKFLLTVSAALLLIATTSFPGVCRALQKLGLPLAFTEQLLFLYRYVFVLTDEAARLARARDQRCFGPRGREWGVFSGLLGVLLIRTLERAERIYQAMKSRGFSGSLPPAREPVFRAPDAAFLAGAIALMLAFRLLPVVETLGSLVGRFLA